MEHAKNSRFVRLVLLAGFAAVVTVGMIVQVHSATVVSGYFAQVIPEDIPVTTMATLPPVNETKTLPPHPTNETNTLPPKPTAPFSRTWIDRNWCPNATCHHSAECYPCHRRYLIILATGRSASTSLTWMLGSLPGIRMSGENNDALNRIRNTMTAIVAHPFPDGLGLKGPWGRHPIPPGSLACAAQGIIQSINPPSPERVGVFAADNEESLAHEILGFKTVRFYNQLNQTSLPVIAKFLKESFPCARYVVNIRRNLNRQLKSFDNAFKMKNIDGKLEAKLAEANIMLPKLAQELGESQAILLDSAQWTKNITYLNNVVKWLGYDDSCAFDQLLEYNTGGRKMSKQTSRRRLMAKYGYGHGRTKLETKDTCRYLGE